MVDVPGQLTAGRHSSTRVITHQSDHICCCAGEGQCVYEYSLYQICKESMSWSAQVDREHDQPADAQTGTRPDRQVAGQL